MGFQDDWLLRQVENIAHFVANVIFQKDTIQYEITDELSNTDILYHKLNRLIKEGKICEAEDLLFDNIEYTKKYIELATDFYQKLSRLNEEQLEKCNFSRYEVYEGFIEILKRLDVPFADF